MSQENGLASEGRPVSPETPPEREVFLEIADLRVERGGKEILKGLTLRCTGGRIVTVTGANGAGKTTLLMAIAGALRVDSGMIRYRGSDAPKRQGARAAGRERIVLVPDHGGTIPLLTVREQLALASILAGETREAAGARAETLISIAGLEGCADARAADLSSGQRKRLGIGIGLSRNADIYLFDEPGNGLDIQGAELLTTLLDTLRARGKIVLVATHPLPLVEEMSDLRWMIREGGVTESAGPARRSQASETAPKDGPEEGGFLPWIRC